MDNRQNELIYVLMVLLVTLVLVACTLDGGTVNELF